jgi:hypothetical protein
MPSDLFIAPTTTGSSGAAARANRYKPVMNLIGFLALVVFVPYSIANEAQFSECMQADEFKVFYSSKSNGVYPVVVEAKPLLGDGVAFRSMYIDKPSVES